jgi:transcriptional regulator with XRE-family HTH domain
MKFFFQKLIDLRTENGLSTDAAAKLLGISEREYRDYEADRRSASPPEKMGIFLALGMNPERAIEEAKEVCGGSLGDMLPLIEAQNQEDAAFAFEREGSFFILERGNGHEYEVPKSRVNSPSDVLVWLEHLAQKTWISTRHLSEFMTLCARHLDINLHAGV